MTESGIGFSGALTHIPGFWESENTNDTWHFKERKGKGYAAMEIIRINSGIRVTCAYKIIFENKILYIEIDNIYFEVIEINVADKIIMKIKNPAGHIITLRKK